LIPEGIGAVGAHPLGLLLSPISLTKYASWNQNRELDTLGTSYIFSLGPILMIQKDARNVFPNS
jgi:hypothetical protein